VRPTQPLRVLAVIDSLAPGGAESSLVAQASALRQFGVETTIVALKEPQPTDLKLDNGVTAIHLSQHGRTLSRVRALRRIIATLRPHVVHTSLFMADLTGRLAAASTRTPVVTSLVTTNAERLRMVDEGVASWKVKLVGGFETLTSPLTSNYHAVTETVASDARSYLRVGPERIHVVYRGRDRQSLGYPSPERRLVWRQREAISPSRLVLAVVARHVRAKSLHTVIQALTVPRLQALDPLILFIGSDGPQTEGLKHLAGMLPNPDCIRWLGVRTDVADAICAADGLVLASLWEGIGGVLLEAMALNTPTICSDLPVTREVVGDSGYFFEAGDPESLARAVEELTSNEAEAQSKVAAGRRRFESMFLLDSVCEQLADLYILTAMSPRFPARATLT
jgi:glycosyltransferase involved in cell wall biosynthesis